MVSVSRTAGQPTLPIAFHQVLRAISGSPGANVGVVWEAATLVRFLRASARSLPNMINFATTAHHDQANRIGSLLGSWCSDVKL